MVILIIYADILIIVNFLTNYFLLLLTFKSTCNKEKILRVILSALVGGISSLYIFLPTDSVLIDLLYKTSLCAVMTLISIGFPNLKQFIRFCFYLFGITSLYGGLIYALFNILKSNRLFFENGIAYFDISPVFLCGMTALFYFGIILFCRIFGIGGTLQQKCTIKVNFDDKTIDLTAMVDTGNSITDYFGKSEIIITDSKNFNKIFQSTDNIKYNNRFRIIPCSTISGEDILKGYRCDKAVITTDEKTITLDKPILAESKISFNDGYNAIINPKILM